MEHQDHKVGADLRVCPSSLHAVQWRGTSSTACQAVVTGHSLTGCATGCATGCGRVRRPIGYNTLNDRRLPVDHSLAQTISLQCPQCGASFAPEVWLIVDGENTRIVPEIRLAPTRR